MNRYETHLTLALDAPDKMRQIRCWADSLELKWTQIELDLGETPCQPMVTFWGTESLSNQLKRAQDYITRIVQLGCSVVRVKVEASVSNDEVPLSDVDTQEEGNRYFEHHLKVLLPNSAELERLRCHTVACNAHLSRNSRRETANGDFERFVTQRIYRHGRVYAKEELDRLIKHLSEAEFHIVEKEEEYVLYDSNIAVDAGWTNDEGAVQ